MNWRYALALFCYLCLPSAWAASSLTLIYSGNLDGELEPCGCSEEGNFGGIKRRATLLAQLRQQQPRLVVVSAGGLLSSEGSGDRLKGEYILKGFQRLQLDAVAVQWRDLAFGPDFIAGSGLPWVLSNVQAGQDKAFAHQRYIRRGQQMLAFFSWLDPSASPLRQMRGEHSLVTEDTATLQAALQQSHQAGHLTILATDLPAEQAAKVLDLAAVDILIERAGYEVYAEPRQLGKTLVLKAGSRGMRLGRLDLTLQQGRIQQWRHQVLPMPSSMPDAPQLQAWYEEYNARVKADYLKRVARRKQQQGGQSPFVGEEACQSCHVAQYQVWSQSQHATAYEDLEGVGKAFDPACIQCHTVGFNQPGGFFDLNITGHLLGVQCENCHGAGRAHVESAGKKALPNAGWSKAQICGQCHTQPHSPGFDLDSYWPKIAH
jgi:2',3'-cyclic-nucleotide 2'-phosphodiesterase (5'-nucleotidase family)